MPLIVLVLVHFLPHLGSFPSSIWIRLPMTTLPWSVFHQLEWFILNLQSSSLPQPHWSFFPLLHVTWCQLCRQYVHVICQNERNTGVKCLNMEIWPGTSTFTVHLGVYSACVRGARRWNGAIAVYYSQFTRWWWRWFHNNTIILENSSSCEGRLSLGACVDDALR